MARRTTERTYGNPDRSNIRYLFQYMLLRLKSSMRLNPRRLIVGAVGLFFFLWFMRYLRFRNLEWEFQDDDTLGHVRDPGMKHNKWIIVTTIQPPTEAVRALNNIEGWKLLVVGDRQTSKTWSLTDAIYLNTAAQKKLGYTVHPLLPYDSYTRKIIGYLYAIEHGAEYIYDTDDDNFPSLGPESFTISMGETQAMVPITKNLTINPYRHFGQSTVWPRGYPLELIGLPDGRNYQLCDVHSPSIQQGLVTGDPDVDAIFRLTRHHGKDRLDYKFDNGAPPMIVPKGTFAPMNSQNTLFTGKAMWALLLPTTVSERATDIYRSYWAQRLLWLVGEHVGFYPPNSHQKRNPHSSLMDSKEESEIYQNTGHLVRFLHGWTCTGVFFFDCVSQLSHDMVTQGFWEHRDAQLVDAWIADLATVGYAPPAIKVRDVCTNDKKTPVVFHPDEQYTTLPHSTKPIIPADLTNHDDIKNTLSDKCGTSPGIEYGKLVQTSGKHDNIILIIGIDKTENVPLIEAAHRFRFPHIIYCSSQPLDTKFFHFLKLSLIKIDSELTTGARCVQVAMTMHHMNTGYLYVSDHAWMAAGNTPLPLKHPNLMWVTGEVDIYKPEMEELCKGRSLLCESISKPILEQFITAVPSINGETKFKSELRQCLVKLASDPNFASKAQLTWITDSSFYIPQRLLPMLKSVDQLFSSNKKQKYDFLTPLLLECLELTVEYLQYTSLSELDESKGVHYLLPFTFTEVSKGTINSQYKSHFCTHFQQMNI